MKISKLFHWLYGLVMLLPIFAIGVTCGYAMFNKNANQSFTYENIDRITDVTNKSMFIEGKNYNANYYTDNSRTSELFIYYSYADIDYSALGIDDTLNWVFIKIYPYANTHHIRFGTDTNYTVDLNVWGNQLKTFTFTYVSNPNTDLNSYNKSSVNFQLITYQKQITSKNVFYYSIDKVQQSPLFNWAYNSFLVTPFAYIVSLFSMPTNSFVVMLLSYWLAISIIWLVFDLVMYVPLMIHRWIDKGVLE